MIEVQCAACREPIGYCCEMSEVDALAYAHDCSATPEERHAAAMNLKFSAIVARLVAEGFPCQ